MTENVPITTEETNLLTTMTIPPNVTPLIGKMSSLSLEDLVLLRQAMTTREGARHCAANDTVSDIFSDWRSLGDKEKAIMRSELNAHIKQTTLMKTQGKAMNSISKPSTDKTMEILEKGLLEDKLERMYHDKVAPILQKWDRFVQLDPSLGPCVMYSKKEEEDDEEEEEEGENTKSVDECVPPPQFKIRVVLRPNRVVKWRVPDLHTMKRKFGNQWVRVWPDIHTCLCFIELIWKWWDNLCLITKQNLLTYIIRTHAITLAMISKIDGGIRWEKFNIVALLAVPKIIREDRCMSSYTANMTWSFETMMEDQVYFKQFGVSKPSWIRNVREEHERYKLWQNEMIAYETKMKKKSDEEEEEGKGEVPALVID